MEKAKAEETKILPFYCQRIEELVEVGRIPNGQLVAVCKYCHPNNGNTNYSCFKLGLNRKCLAIEDLE
jgi:hypothetical protein